jgi:hypothetical protein
VQRVTDGSEPAEGQVGSDPPAKLGPTLLRTATLHAEIGEGAVVQMGSVYHSLSFFIIYMLLPFSEKKNDPTMFFFFRNQKLSVVAASERMH